jgi:hypothetical protein
VVVANAMQQPSANVTAFDAGKRLVGIYLLKRTAVDDGLKIPSSASEDEEAEWWFQNREELADDFARAASEKRLKSGSTVLRRAEECAASILHWALEKA